MTKQVEQYRVMADPETGEWLDEPEYVGVVDLDEWHTRQDNHTVHFDTYEVSNEDDVTTTTRAIEVVWSY